MRNSKRPNRHSRRGNYRTTGLSRKLFIDTDDRYLSVNRRIVNDNLQGENYREPYGNEHSEYNSSRHRKRNPGENAMPGNRLLNKREQEQQRYRQKKRDTFPAMHNEDYRRPFYDENGFQTDQEERQSHLREKSFEEWRRAKRYNEHEDDNLAIRIRDDYYATGYVNEVTGAIPGDYYELIRDAEEYDYQGRDRLKYKNAHQRYRSVNY